MKVAGGKRSAPTGKVSDTARPRGAHEALDYYYVHAPRWGAAVVGWEPVGAVLSLVEPSHRLP
jgi:hypothetical protein